MAYGLNGQGWGQTFGHLVGIGEPEAFFVGLAALPLHFPREFRRVAIDLEISSTSGVF